MDTLNLWRDLPAAGHPDGRTLASEARDFHEWHLGRPRFAVCAIPIDDARVQRRLDEVRTALHPLLLPGDERQPHITIQICGFPVRQACRPADFTPAQLQAQVGAIAHLAPASFRLHIGGAFSFLSAPCLAVSGNGLRTLHDLWRPEARPLMHDRWIPHVTAGLYRHAWPMADIERRLQALADLPPIELEIRALEWMSYDCRRIDGPLQSWLRIELPDEDAGTAIRVRAAPALDEVFAA